MSSDKHYSCDKVEGHEGNGDDRKPNLSSSNDSGEENPQEEESGEKDDGMTFVISYNLRL